MLKYITQKVKASQIDQISEGVTLIPAYQSICIAFGKEVADFIAAYTTFKQDNTLIIFTTHPFNIHVLARPNISTIINLARVNDISKINAFFETVNEKLPSGGIFIGCVETKGSRRLRIYKKYPPVINKVVYLLDFIFKRIFPKLALTRTLYFKITGGRNRILSRTETLGRLFACGFRVIEEKMINNKLFFVAEKSKEPAYEPEPSPGIILKLKRIGKDGKIIHVYKIRTMHAFAEYVQEYVYQKHHLQNGGKFNNDFRVSSVGRFLRKYWIDELPMIINFFKGDLKLVGVRPLSKHYLSLYTPELKARRLRFKPGLIPPFYADLPRTIEEIMQSENRYLDRYERSPFLTDLKYFFKALYNILFRKARSC
jgi:lipopolysaccharide/colanic/teichoic acid biosynthesis glycosyltransferase